MGIMPRNRLLDTDSNERKTYPMASGLLDYFPDALAAIAQHSFLANEKHNPGEPMHHARGKSMDHADCILRHLVGRGSFDGPYRESTALAWRALALLQEELELELGLTLPRAARAVKQEQQFQNVPSDADAHSRQCPMTSVICHACPPGETCRAQYTGSRAPHWVKDQVIDQPPYHTMADTGFPVKLAERAGKFP